MAKCNACDYPYADCNRCPNCGCTSPTGCFITEAACSYAGLPDNCHELRVLRDFRDSYMLSDPEMRRSVDYYYLIAPSIVEAIDAAGNPREAYSRLMKDYLRPSIEAVEQRRPNDARRIYARMMRELTDRYMVGV